MIHTNLVAAIAAANDHRPQSEPPFMAEGTSSCPQSGNSSLVTKSENCYDEKVETSNGTERTNYSVPHRMDPREENVAERCAFDPVTKRRFYEPHKRSGCDGVYCLSQITQIGERICSVENKLARLSQLFNELVQERNEPSTHPAENGNRMLTTHLRQRRHTRHPITLGTVEQRSQQQTTTIPSVYQQRPRPQPETGLSLSSKVLDYGLRIYFPGNEMLKGANAATVCPVCFAKFEPFPTLYAHVLRHLDKKCMAEFFSCKLCKGPNPVHFLSVAAIREHIRTAHGVATDSYLLINIYPGNNAHRGTTRTMLQDVLKGFARIRYEHWRCIGHIKTMLLSLKSDCSPVDCVQSKNGEREGKREMSKTQPLRKKSRKTAEGAREEEAVDRIVFSSTQMPQTLSERFHRLKKIDRVCCDQLIVPICEKSLLGLCNSRISSLANNCKSGPPSSIASE